MTSDRPTPIESALAAEARGVRNLARAILRDDAMADDVVQDVAVAALRNGGGLAADAGRFRAWLCGVTRRLAWRALRDRQRREQRERRAARPEIDPGSPADHAAEVLRTQRVLHDAIEALPEPYRTTIVMRFFDGLAPREIARRRGISADLVRQHVHRGLARLRQTLDARFPADRDGFRGALALLAFGTDLFRVASHGVAAALAMSKTKTLALAGAAILGLGTAWFTVRGVGVADESATRSANRDPVEAAATTPIASSPRSPIAESASVLVVAEDGSPVAGATVVAWHGDRVSRARTDSRGNAPLHELDRIDGVVAIAEGFDIADVRVPSPASSCRVTLQRGTNFVADVFVDGALAPAGLELAFGWSNLPIRDLLPAAVGAALAAEERASLRSRRFTTTPRGTLEVAGLPLHWTGTVAAPRDLWFTVEHGVFDPEYDPNILRLAEPPPRIAMRLRRVPSLRYRLVWDDDGSPARGVHANARVFVAGGVDTPMFGLSIDERGCGSKAIRPSSSRDLGLWRDPASLLPAVERVTVWLGGAGVIQEQLEFAGATLPADLDLGELRLRRVPLEDARVLDTDGRPIAGAYVQGLAVSAPTDTEGRTAVRAEANAAIFLVGAPRHGVQRLAPRITSDAGGAAVREFVLARQGRLVLRVLDAGGEPISGHHLRLSGTRAPFAATSGFSPSAVHRRLFGQDPNGSWSDALGMCEFEDSRGELALDGLAPDVLLTVQVFDRHQMLLAARDVRTPSGEDDVVVDLRLPAKPVAIDGIVFDPAGRPLADAHIRPALGEAGAPSDDWLVLMGASLPGPSVRSALDGRFLLDGVHPRGGELAIEVTHREFAPIRVEFGISATVGLRIRLEEGREMIVDIVDQDGRAVDAVELAARAAALPIVAAERIDGRPGSYRFARLPRRAVLVTCEIGARRVQLAIEGTTNRARFVLPSSGIAVLSARPPDGIDPRVLRFRCTRAGEPELLLRGALNSRFTASGVRLAAGTWHAALIDIMSGAILAGPVEFDVVCGSAAQVTVGS